MHQNKYILTRSMVYANGTCMIMKLIRLIDENISICGVNIFNSLCKQNEKFRNIKSNLNCSRHEVEGIAGSNFNFKFNHWSNCKHLIRFLTDTIFFQCKIVSLIISFLYKSDLKICKVNQYVFRCRSVARSILRGTKEKTVRCD